VQLDIGIVSENRDSSLHRVCIVCVTTVVANCSNTLQQLP
jgi:hypothetical protein